jgi:hypothetical protein
LLVLSHSSSPHKYKEARKQSKTPIHPLPPTPRLDQKRTILLQDNSKFCLDFHSCSPESTQAQSSSIVLETFRAKKRR